MSIKGGLIDDSNCVFLSKYKGFQVAGICAAPYLNTVDEVWMNNCIINSFIEMGVNKKSQKFYCRDC